jgi:serum/glucocorticoid-regulated kinase 2
MYCSYMIMDYMSGGELFFWLERKRRFPESCAKLYVAEVALAIEALHSKNFIYRDLKPENILMDSEGHIKLTDFGLAKGGITGSGPQGGTITFCGSTDYMAPEMILKQGHGKAVDWWALGILFFELICGIPPFYNKHAQEVYRKILHDPLIFPVSGEISISEPAKSVIRGLLDRDISKRLGSGPTGAMELKMKKLFGQDYFDKVYSKEIVPEFTPSKLRSDDDVSHFDNEFTEKDIIGSLRTEINNKGLKNHIDDFTFLGGHDHGNPL